jgi:hypothetical protein
MSAAQVSDIEKIYVPLLDEGTHVIRPTLGEPLGGGLFRIMPTPSYDPEDEIWAFLPGSIVRCVSEIYGDEEILLATELISD